MVFQLWPDAQFVNVIRDPRAAVASMLPLGWDPPEVALEASIANWELAVSRVDAFAGKLRPDQLLDVRYEDLVRDPGPVLERVCAFASLDDAVDEMLAAVWTVRFSSRRCPLFVRVLVRTGPNQRRAHVGNEASFIGANWEGLVPLPPLDGLENH